MKHTNFARRATSLSVAAGSSLLGLLLFAPSAFAIVVKPGGEGSSSAVTPQTAPSTAHSIITGGMAGWQITLIAVGAALVAATVTALMGRTRVAHQGPRVSVA